MASRAKAQKCAQFADELHEMAIKVKNLLHPYHSKVPMMLTEAEFLLSAWANKYKSDEHYFPEEGDPTAPPF